MTCVSKISGTGLLRCYFYLNSLTLLVEHLRSAPTLLAIQILLAVFTTGPLAGVSRGGVLGEMDESSQSRTCTRGHPTKVLSI